MSLEEQIKGAAGADAIDPRDARTGGG